VEQLRRRVLKYPELPTERRRRPPTLRRRCAASWRVFIATQRDVELSCVVEVFIATLRRNSTRRRVELSCPAINPALNVAEKDRIESVINKAKRYG